MKKITFTETQVSQMRAALEGITTQGIQNALRIVFIAQTLGAGEQEEADDQPEAQHKERRT